jgi:hypothetical protein
MDLDFGGGVNIFGRRWVEEREWERERDMVSECASERRAERVSGYCMKRV